jgi:predicted permease
VIVVHTLGPIFLLVLIGVLFRRVQMPGGDFWPLAERITYFVFFPALLIRTLATADFTDLNPGRVFLATTTVLIAMSAALLLGAPLLARTGAAFTSLFQGAIRFNSYVGFAAAAGLWGEQGLTYAALVVACMVPLVNLLCISVFALKVQRSIPLLKQVLLNPLIMACLAGIALNVSGIGMPGWSDALFEILGRPALPLGLLAIGVGLSWHGLRAGLAPLLSSSAIKLLIIPAIAVFVCRAFALPPEQTAVVVTFAALPTASSSYILARQLGGDATLMAAIITFQTLAAMATLPLVLALLVPA